MTEKNIEKLWPDFEFEQISTPVLILQQQATELGEQTKNVLIGDIITTEAYDEKTKEMVLIYQFFIKAPFLSNYRYLLFRLLQRTNLYPVDIYFDADNRKIENIEESDFKNKLKDIFNNPKTTSTIKSLYAQSIQMKSSG